LAFLPRVYGNSEVAVDSLAIFGAIALSHPLEVARVLVVNGASESSAMFGSTAGTLQSIYQAEGVAGMYRGLTPRAVYLFPTLLTLAEVFFPGETILGRFRRTETAAVDLGQSTQPLI